MTPETEKAAKILWNYLQMQQPLEKADAIFVLGSLDDRVAEYGADLFLQGYGSWFIVSGGVAHKNDLLATKWTEDTEAEHFAAIAKRRGVPAEKIILEDRATNTGENIRFVFELLRNHKIALSSFLLLQKPYMERRAFATFKKQWPDTTTRISITSPPLSYDSYFNDDQPKEKIVNIMVGDLQRIRDYPKLGFQIEQEIPVEVHEAFQCLVDAGYTQHLLPHEKNTA